MAEKKSQASGKSSIGNGDFTECPLHHNLEEAFEQMAEKCMENDKRIDLRFDKLQDVLDAITEQQQKNTIAISWINRISIAVLVGLAMMLLDKIFG